MSLSLPLQNSNAIKENQEPGVLSLISSKTHSTWKDARGPTSRGVVPNSLDPRPDPESLWYVEQITHLCFMACSYVFIAKKIHLSTFKRSYRICGIKYIVFWVFYNCMLDHFHCEALLNQ